MKKVISGKLYNTETAKRLAIYENSNDSSDFNYISEDLYLTKSGAYFIHGEGGAMTQYADRLNENSWGSGEEIIPISYQTAKEWAEEHTDADKYAELFGEPEEAGEGRATLNLYVSNETKAILKRMNEEQGRSISQIVDEMVMNQ